MIMQTVRALAALILATTPVAASAEWARYEAPHFTIYSESQPKAVEVLTAGSRRWIRCCIWRPVPSKRGIS